MLQVKLNQVEMAKSQGYGLQIVGFQIEVSFAKVLSHTKVKNVHVYGTVTHISNLTTQDAQDNAGHATLMMAMNLIIP
jgi:hypothetical protein